MNFIIMNQSLVETFNSDFKLKAEWVETGKKLGRNALVY